MRATSGFQRGNKLQLRHGHAVGGVRSRTYKSWESMVSRCRNPADDHYATYGAAGIAVCDRWLIFDSFLSDMGDRPRGKTLDRIDSRGNYEPGNCRWATPREQARNRKSNRVIEFEGRKQPLADWADEFGLSQAALKWRLDNGFSVRDALLRPLKPDRRRAKNGEGPT